MQSIQIDGTFTYIQNVKTLKLGDKIKLIKNPNNHVTKDAVGAYTMDNKKIGYVPFKSTQIDLKSNYTVEKINLTREYPQILISRVFEVANVFTLYPKTTTNKQLANNNIKDFIKMLIKKGVLITNYGITYEDENFIDIFIETPEGKNTYHTVTRKYYEEHIFYYDEFYNFNLIPLCIYQPFQIHRLESYIEKNYTSLSKILKSKKNSKSILYDNTKFNMTETKIDDNISEINIIELNKIFNTNLQTNGMSYNHTLKAYCSLDYYDDTCIYDIDYSPNNILSRELILKSIISNKKIIMVLNPLNKMIYNYNIIF